MSAIEAAAEFRKQADDVMRRAGGHLGRGEHSECMELMLLWLDVLTDLHIERAVNEDMAEQLVEN